MSRLVFLVSLMLFSVTGYAEVLRLHGSNTIGAALMPALIEAWLPTQGYKITAKESPDDVEVRYTAINANEHVLHIDIASHGSSTAFSALAEGRADLGMSSRRINHDEIERLAPAGPMNRAGHELVLALDAVAVIVHPNNPLRSLSVAQVRDIFSGRVSNWDLSLIHI